jgi:hypothetical protein
LGKILFFYEKIRKADFYLLNHAKGVDGILPQEGMESTRSVVWNHYEVMYGIAPQGRLMGF